MVIVTGGAGFIGSAFVAKLNQLGEDDILIVDNLNESMKWKNLVGLQYQDYLHKNKFIEKIIESKEAFGDISAVIHMGACSSTTEADADYLFENNVYFSENLVNWAVEKDARVIYASSAATYGQGFQGFNDEINLLNDLVPINRYGYSKHFFDLKLLRNGLFDKVVGLKFFNVFGPNEYHKESMASVVYKAFNQISAQQGLQLFKSYHPDYNHGEQMRDFIYVKDVVSVMIELYQKKDINGLFNLGTGKARTWKDLAGAVFSAMGLPENVQFIDMPENIRGAYQYFTEAPMGNLERAGIKHSFLSLEDAIHDYVKNHLAKDFDTLNRSNV